MDKSILRNCPHHGVPLESGAPPTPPPTGLRADVVAMWRCPKSMCSHVIVEAVCPECRRPLEYLQEPAFGTVVGGDGHGSSVHLPAKLHCRDHGEFEWPFAQAIVRRANPFNS